MKVIPTCGLALAVWLAGPAWGGPSPTPREAIETAYNRAAEAASLKFLHGMVGGRAPGFQGYGVDGKRVDSRAERAGLERLILPALSVKETSRILSFQQIDANHVTCQVQDVLEITRVDRAKKTPMLLIVDTTSKDEWIRTAKGWKQISNRVARQSFDTRQLVSAPDSSTPSATPSPPSKK